ncbi:MAG: hypothetical protein H0T42_30465 [Deltaproteobacteria bacterium]|nr:hypothetical protein [Deltaproteobacteria bacterium]
MHRIALLATVLLAASACGGSKKSDSTAPTGGGGAAGGTALGKTMDTAPTQTLPVRIDVTAPCNDSGYFKLDVPAGQAFSIDAKVSAGSAMIDVADANGKSAGVSAEVTVDAPKTISATGQEGGTFVTTSETGACVGGTVTLDMK